MKVRHFLFLAVTLVAVFTTTARAQEKAVLAVPVVAPSVTEYSLRYFAIDLENQRILIELKSNTGELKQVVYVNSAPVSTTNPDGTVTVTPSDNKASTLISALNSKADMRAKSLEKRIFEQLMADGHLAGVVVGTPR
jgi:hypothetical protein